MTFPTLWLWIINNFSYNIQLIIAGCVNVRKVEIFVLLNETADKCRLLHILIKLHVTFNTTSIHMLQLLHPLCLIIIRNLPTLPFLNFVRNFRQTKDRYL